MASGRLGMIGLLAAIAVCSAGSANASGALAIGACGAFGHAYDYATEAEARAAAMAQCSGQGCRVVAVIRNSCAALAIDGANPCGAHGFASAPRLGNAQNNALRQCYRFGGKDCVIRAWACDGRAR